jgi:hypothetical protein
MNKIGKTHIKLHFSMKKFINTLSELNEWNEIMEKKSKFKNMSNKI